MAKSTSKAKSTPSGYSLEETQESQSALLELFTDEIKDIYWAEQHLTIALPRMKLAATSAELQTAFATHLKQTKVHIERLEQVFELLEEKPLAKKCDAMEGLVQEGEGIIQDTKEGTSTRDVGLILAAQKVEHYEIATYGGLTQIAKVLGRNDIAEILAETLTEEKQTDELLTSIAENTINYQSTTEEA